ncbi:MAG TPA: hypothetical protein DCE56_05895 [Cyanobacteria bacterium UBA8553]|nr:hypothetical protein [Cyanobacteria bacterium UBA8553]
MGEALLDFSTMLDLLNWLEQQEQQVVADLPGFDDSLSQ